MNQYPVPKGREHLKVAVSVTKVADDAIIPAYQSRLASGFDLAAYLPHGPIVLGRRQTAIVPTGLRFAVPPGFELQIRPRSGMAANKTVTVLNSPGTVDADYRGEVKVILFNAGLDDLVIEHGDRIAQGVVCPVYQVEFIAVDSLDATDRGEGGFGSTGRGTAVDV